jgi:hypothetical protein
MSRSSIPVVSLTVLGVLIAVLGLFAAGDIVIVIVGLSAIFGAGLIGVAERLAERRRISPPVREEGR